MRKGLLIEDAPANVEHIIKDNLGTGSRFTFRVRATIVISITLIIFLVLFWVNVFLLTRVPFTFKDLVTIITFSFRRTSANSEIVVDTLSVEPVQRSL